MKTLEYYFDSGTHVIFNKYTIGENGVIRNKKTEKVMATHTNKGGYSRCGVYDNEGKKRMILVGRAIASTFKGSPPTYTHTADHIDRNPTTDTVNNIRWLCKSGQSTNQERPNTRKSAFIIVKDGIEKTIKEWLNYLKNETNSFGRKYTRTVINNYAQRKQHGFSYKAYPDISGEVWKEIIDSDNKTGRWEISNMNRVKYITKYAENVFSKKSIGTNGSGYPIVTINGSHLLCHILSFMTFFPDEYASKSPEEFVLHEDDNKLDFRPHKLRLGTQSENMIDAYKNGCYDETKSAMMKCASYIDGVFEKEHESQRSAVRYLKTIGYDNSKDSNIGNVLNGSRKTAYGRSWKRI